MPAASLDPLQLALEERLTVLAPGRFVWERRIQDDPLGAWFLGTDSTTARKVRALVIEEARLIMQPRSVQDAVAGWLQESAALADRAQRTAPGIIPPVVLTDPEGSPPLLIREHVEGMPLAEVVRRQGAGSPAHLPAAMAGPLLEAVLESLAKLHSAGIRVPGLSPETLCLTDAAPRARVLLPLPHPVRALDWSWQAPEQLEDPNHSSAATDCWRLGALLYWTVTGHLPFAADLGPDGRIELASGPEQVRQWRQYHPQPLPPSRLVAGLPPVLDTILCGLLAREPASRLSAQAALSQWQAPTATRPGLLSGLASKLHAEPSASQAPAAQTLDVQTLELEPLGGQPGSSGQIPGREQAEVPGAGAVLAAPRSWETLRKPLIAGGVIALLLVSLWVWGRPRGVAEQEMDWDAIFRDLPQDLQLASLEETPAPQPLAQPEAAAAPKPPTPTREPDPPPARQEPPAAAEPQPEPERPVASTAIVVPPEATIPTPQPSSEPSEPEPLPDPTPSESAVATEPQPSQPQEAAPPRPAPAPEAAPRPTGDRSLFDLDSTTPTGGSAGTTPAIDPPAPGPAPAIEPRPVPGPRQLPSFTGPPLHSFSAHERQVWAVDISPDGRTIASGGRDEYAALWDINAGTNRARLSSAGKDHENWIIAVSYSRDGRYLATGSEDATVKVWDLRNGNNLVTTFRTPGDAMVVRSLDFDPQSTRLYVGYGDGRGTVRILDTATWKEATTTLRHGGGVRAMQVSPDGRLLATGGQDHVARLWNTRNGQLVATLQGHKGWVQAIGFNGKGQIATGSSDGSVKIWTATGELVHTLPSVHKGGVYSLAFRTSDGRLLATGGADGAVKLFDASDASSKGSFGGHLGIITSLVFTPQGNRLVTATLQDPLGGRTEPNIRVYKVD